MTRSQRRVLFIGFCVIALMWAFPPWIHFVPNPSNPNARNYSNYPRGYFFIADTSQGESDYMKGQGIVFRIDFGRLAVQSVAVGAITALAFFAFARKP